MTTTETREFPIDDIVSVTSGLLVSKSGLAGVHQLLAFMAGETIWTHQIPRVMNEAQENLRTQCPDLADIDVPDWQAVDEAHREAAVYAWVDELRNRLGETREIRPLAAEDHTSIDPISELRMMRPGVQIIGVQVDTDTEGNDHA